MAKEIKQKKSVKKVFYEVSAPITSTKIQLYASGKEELNGKTIRLDLTKNLRGKSLELLLRVKLLGDKLLGEPESVQLMGSYIRRAIRKGTDYCEDSFEAECRDCVSRVKTLFITRRRVSKAILKSLRENSGKWLETYVKTRTGQEIISEIVSNKLQKQLAVKLKKIYPLVLCEVRMFEIIKGKTEQTQK